MTLPRIAPQTIAAELAKIIPPGEVFEVRVLDAVTAEDRRPHTESGYFNDPGKAAKALAVIRDCLGCYFTLNQIDPALLSRAQNRIRAPFKKPTTADKDVTGRRWLPIDLDPMRPSDTSSTDAEHEAAIDRARAIYGYLKAAGWTDPIGWDSGNGAGLLYPVDLPADDGGLIERCLAALAGRFDDDGVTVDETTHNPARLWKVPGTLAGKGDSTADRPHRLARILHAPATLTPVPRELLEALAGPAPTPAPPAKRNGQQWTGERFDLPAWIARHNLAVRGPERWTSKEGASGQRWVFDICPWDSGHANGSAFIVQMDSGVLGAGCHHDGCIGKDWHALRELVEPGWNRTPPTMPRTVGIANPQVAAVVVTGQAPSSDRLTDMGNGERFAAQHRDEVLYDVACGQWRSWSGCRWELDTLGRVLQLAKSTARSIYAEAVNAPSDAAAEKIAAWAKRSEASERLNAMVNLARTEPGMSVPAATWDQDIFAFNCLNGTIDLRTGNLRQHKPEDLITKQAPVAYDPAAESPRFDAFMDRILPRADVAEYLQRWFGYCLTGDITIEIMLVFHGPGANGKSKLIDSTIYTMGDYADQAPPDLLLAKWGEQHPCELADLRGKRLVVASESEKGRRLRMQLVKRLTGDASIKARFMRENYFTFPRTSKLILITNNKPRVDEDSVATWRRLKLIPFTVTIPEEERDPDLLEKLKAEASGILRWMVEGCVRWASDRKLVEPVEVKDATGQYRAESDPLAGFFAECCILAPNAWTSTAALRGEYERYCSETGDDPIRPADFREGLRKRNCTPRPTKYARGWTGIGLQVHAAVVTVMGDGDGR